MSRVKIILLIVAVCGMKLPAAAQGNTTNSPYSRWGYGILSDHSIGAGHAMGGIGYGLQSPSQINVLNPASYAAIDSLTFLFDLGADFSISRMKEEGYTQKFYNGSIKNINLLFPVGKSFAFSAGFIPVSAVGYEYSKVEDNGRTDYSGTGGMLQVYGGLAYKYKDFSVGMNVGYLFGSLEQYIVTSGVGNPNIDSIVIRPHDLTFTLGVQQKIRLNEKQSLILGLAYTPKIQTTGKSVKSFWVGSNQEEYAVVSGYDLAQTTGVGASLLMQDRWLVGADIKWENWKDARFADAKNVLNDRWRYGAGAEYTPDAKSRSFFKRTKYRIGSYYTNSYITTDKGCSYDEFGLSAGVALPVYGKSLLHLSLDYVNIVPSIAHLLSENYFKVTLNYTFNETWFYKRRIK
jgi:hypothetical protein